MDLRILLLAAILLAAGTASAATFVVTSSADTDGTTCGSVCTLRQAIAAANATSAADTINFGIQLPIKGEILIRPGTPLPAITQPLTINGYSQSGTRPNDSTAASNAILRIRIDGALPGTSALHGLAVCASNSVVRGLSITRFLQTGILVGDSPCAGGVSNVQIHGNFIGVSGSGVVAAGNGNNGVRAVNSGVRIGQTLADRNLISANGVFGIDLRGGNTQKFVQNNLIGTDKTGSQDFGNGTGVRTNDNANSSLISQNIIKFNGTGIDIESGTDHRIRQNVIFANDDLGIDLGAFGVNPNDLDDLDTGANLQQNFPLISSARRNETGVTISATLDIGHSTQIDYEIDLFASSSCDPSGAGEGERFLGSLTESIREGSQNISSRDVATDDPLPPGTLLTVTATPANATGTSEFSTCFPMDPPPLLVNSNDDVDDGTCDASHCSLREAMIAANATPSGFGDLFVNFAIPPLTGTSEIVIAPATPLPQITRGVLIDGYSQPGSQTNSDATVSNAVPRIRLQGSPAATVGFDVCRLNVTIRGLALTGFEDAIAMQRPGCVNGTALRALGNFFGLATDGVTAAANGRAIAVGGAPDSLVIGGDAPEDRNVFAGGSVGIDLGIEVDTQVVVSNRTILGNLFGTDKAGTQNRAITRAIAIRNASASLLIGSVDAPNAFRFNGTAIEVTDTARRHRFAENHFVGQSGLAVDLGGDGVTANDADDADTGPNGRQNFPVLTFAERNVDGIRIIGNVDVPGTPSPSSLTVTFYASATCDSSGNGEGEQVLGRAQLTESFDVVVTTDVDLVLNPFITATATHTDGTSEFSACLLASDPPTGIAVDSALDAAVLDGGCDLVGDANLCTLREAITLANSQAGDDRIRFAIPGSVAPHVIQLESLLPVITGGLTIDGYTQEGASQNAAAQGFDANLRVELRPVGLTHGLRICATELVDIAGFAFATGTGPMIATQANDAGNCAAVGNLRLRGNQFGLRASGDTSAVAGAVDAVNSVLTAGGAALADRNVFANSTGAAVRIAGTASSGSRVQNNLFGRDGELLGHPNDLDVEISNASGVVVGGEGVLANDFSGSSAAVVVAGVDADNNSAYANRFRAHTGATAIDLTNGAAADGVDANDVDDADTGANEGQNSPLLTGGEPDANSITIEGALDVPAGIATTTNYRLAFYRSATCSDTAGVGREGEVYLGSVLRPFTSGSETFTVTLNVAPEGGFVTATATSPSGSTSEFSNCLVAPQVVDVFGDGFE